MPVIPRYQEQRVDTRVQEANLNREGTGIVARAIGAIGAEGAQFANELLQRRKIAEASAYSNESTRIKQIESERKQTELYNDMDPLTGRVKSTGRSYFDEMQDWENARMEELANDAPTDLARDSFKKMEMPSITGRLAKADEVQYKSMYKAQVQQDESLSSDDSKDLLGHDNESGVSVYELGNSKMQDAEKMILSKVGTIYGEAEAKAMADKYNNVRAVSGTESMLQQMALKDFARANGLMRMKPEQFSQFKQALAGEGIIPKGGEVVFDKNGDPLLIGAKIGRDKVGFKNLFTGATGEADIAFTQKQVINAEPIGVGADASPNNFYKYLTEENIKDNMWKLARAMKEKQDMSKRELVNEVSNWTTSLSTTSANRLRTSNPDTGKAFNEILSRIDNISSDLLPDLEKNDLKINLFSSKHIGEFKDRSKFRNIVASAQDIKTMKDSVMADVMKSGTQDRFVNSPAFAASVTERAMAESSNYLADISRKTNTNMASYLAEVDPQFLRNEGKKFNSPQDFKNYTDHVERRMNQMGVPAHNAKYFTPDALASDSNSLMTRINNGDKDGMAGAINWLNQRKNAMGDKFVQYSEEISDYGIPKDLKYIALFPNNMRGNTTAQRALENTITAKERSKIIPQDVQGQIFLKAQEKLAPFLEGIRRKYPASTRDGNVVAFLQTTINEAHRNFISNGGDMDSAVKDSVQMMVGNNYSSVQRGSTVITMPLMQQQMYGLNEDKIKLADKYYTSKDYIINNVDLERTFPQVKQLLDERGIVGAERSTKAYEYLNSGVSNISGDFTLQVSGERAFPNFYTRATGDQFALYGKDGKLINIPLKEIGSKKEVLDQSLNFFGEAMDFETKLFKGK